MSKKETRGCIDKLRKLAIQRKFLPIRDRIEAVILRKSHHSFEEISHKLGYSKSWSLKWCHRYKTHGVKGLFDDDRSGRPSFLNEDDEARFLDRIQKGPQEKDGVSVFTAKSIQQILLNEFNITYSYKSIYNILHRLDLSRIRPRPRHEKNDPEKMKFWKSSILPSFYRKVVENNPSKKIEFWFQDETRFGNKTQISAIWAEKGSSPRIQKQIGFKNAYIFGAVNPNNGNSAGLVFSNCDSEMMNYHLSLIGSVVPAQSHAILILDQAGFHSKCKALDLPMNLSLLNLPPYSPELNPMELLWLYIKSHYLKNRLLKKDEDLLELGCELWNRLTPEIIKSVANVSYLSVTNF